MVKRSLRRFLDNSELCAAIIASPTCVPLLPLARLTLAAMSAEIDNLAGERTRWQRPHSPWDDWNRRRAQRILVCPATAPTPAAPAPGRMPNWRTRTRAHPTVAFGSTGRVAFPLGNGEVIYRELPPDSATLEALANRTGGSHFSVREASDMDAILARIHDMEKTRIPVPAQAWPWYWLPAALGLLCLLHAEYSRRREATA